MKKSQDYLFQESTISLCSTCGQRISAKIVIQDGSVFIRKNCPEHGLHSELLEESSEYHLLKRKYDKKGTFSEPQTKVDKGCPFDCGLCPEHDQHSCIGLIEVTNKCNLHCPVCFANSGKDEFLTLDEVEKSLDFFVASEYNDAEILQISGGEPTIHPQIIDIIKIAKSKNIRFVMLNTNGLRIAEDIEFVKELSQFQSGFEIYLQFDGFSPSSHEKLRGKNLVDIKLKAIENLLAHNIPITLVTSVAKGINEGELGKIINFALEKKGVRGINFQPVAFFGRYDSDVIENRITLSGVINRLETQAPELFEKGDIVPLPCNVERVAISYLIRNKKGKYIPLPRHLKIDSYLPIIENTFAFDSDRILNRKASDATESLPLCDCFQLVKDIHKLIPKTYILKSEAEKRRYIDENTFRISVVSFVDKYNFDLKSMQKECVHIITKDLKRIPFSAYNMFHRNA